MIPQGVDARTILGRSWSHIWKMLRR